MKGALSLLRPSPFALRSFALRPSPFALRPSRLRPPPFAPSPFALRPSPIQKLTDRGAGPQMWRDPAPGTRHPSESPHHSTANPSPTLPATLAVAGSPRV